MKLKNHSFLFFPILTLINNYYCTLRKNKESFSEKQYIKKQQKRLMTNINNLSQIERNNTTFFAIYQSLKEFQSKLNYVI